MFRRPSTRLSRGGDLYPAPMRVTAVDSFPVTIPLRKPVQMSHVTIAASHNVLVRVSTDEGIEGWGEGVEAFDLTGENQGRIKAAIDALGQDLIGKDPLTYTAHWHNWRRRVYENSTAIGALDIALHDLAGRALGLPVHQLLGGAIRNEIPALTLIGSGDPEADRSSFEAKYQAGYRWFKLKLGITDPSREAHTFRLITEAAASDVVICGDVNAGWGEHEALRFLSSIADLPVRFVEQPTRDRRSLLRLADRSPIPICADESAHSLQDILDFATTSLAGVSLKLIKLGGITGVMRGAALCQTAGLHINLAGKVAESSIAAAANLHCAAAIGDLHFGCSPGNQGIAADVTTDPPNMEEGVFTVPTAPGLGVEVDETLVKELAS